MKYLLFDEVSGQEHTIHDWVIVAMPKTAKGTPNNDDSSTKGDAMMNCMFGEFEDYRSPHYPLFGKLFKNLSALKRFLRASRDFSMGSNALHRGTEKYMEVSHWINHHVKATYIKIDTEKEGGLNGSYHWDEECEEGYYFPPKKADEEL